MNYIEKYLELVPNATSFSKDVMQEIIQQAITEERERTMQYLWGKIQDDYKRCSIEYFLKDQAEIMKIDLITNLDKDK